MISCVRGGLLGELSQDLFLNFALEYLDFRDILNLSLCCNDFCDCLFDNPLLWNLKLKKLAHPETLKLLSDVISRFSHAGLAFRYLWTTNKLSTVDICKNTPNLLEASLIERLFRRSIKGLVVPFPIDEPDGKFSIEVDGFISFVDPGSLIIPTQTPFFADNVTAYITTDKFVVSFRFSTMRFDRRNGYLCINPEGIGEVVEKLNASRAVESRRISGTIVDGYFVGERHTKFHDGALHSQSFDKDGKSCSDWIIQTYPNGRISKIPLIDGIKCGKYHSVWPNGVVGYGQYKNDRSCGMWTMEYPDGSFEENDYEHNYGTILHTKNGEEMIGTDIVFVTKYTIIFCIRIFPECGDFSEDENGIGKEIIGRYTTTGTYRGKKRCGLISFFSYDGTLTEVEYVLDKNDSGEIISVPCGSFKHVRTDYDNSVFRCQIGKDYKLFGVYEHLKANGVPISRGVICGHKLMKDCY